MPRRRRNDYEDLPEDEFESDFEDPVAALADRIMERPEVQDAIGSIGSFVESAGGIIDSLGNFAARGGRRRPKPRQAPPRVEYRTRVKVVRERAPEDPRLVLGFPPGVQLTKDMVKKRKRALAALYHPDQGGSTESMQRLNAAAEALLRELG